MKVLYIGNGLTHYYNLVLSRLNSEPGIELTVIAPVGVGGSIGDGVYQTKDGINFRLIELKEIIRFRFYLSFEGLSSVIQTEQPDVIIVLEGYLRAFLFDPSVVLAIKSVRSGLILKSIPFRYSNYTDQLKGIAKSDVDFRCLSSFTNGMLRKLGLINVIRHFELYITKSALNIADAHVNYVEAYDYWKSYGISKNKIFITRNSPDTDQLFAIRKDIKSLDQSILPYNPYRLIHVGRLVEWKRVDMLLMALAQVKKHYPDAELLIIGTGSEKERLEKIASDNHLVNSVKFLGGVYDQKLLGKYFLSSSLYVLAGMGGLSINEAMCFGLPILCSVCDGTEKVLVREDYNGKYFQDGNEEDLVNKIIWFFEHPNQSKEMGRRSEEIICNEVNINTVINGYISALNYVAKKKGKGSCVI